MAKVHEIGIGADTRAFEDSIKSGVIKPTEDAAGAMDRLADATGGTGAATGKAGDQVASFADKLADAARKAGKSDDEIRDALKQMGVSADDARRAVDKLGDEFKDTGREGERGAGEAERGVDKLEDALKKAQRETKELGDKADDAGDKARRGMERAEEGVKDFKQEAQQSARETAASFDGSFESIAELGQEIAANAFAGFGPAGAAAGIAVAGAGGAMIETFNKVEEAAEEARDSAFSLAYDVAGAMATAGYTQRVSEWTSSTEKYKQVTDLAAASGMDQVDVIDALASGGDKLGKLTDAFARNAEASGKLSPGRIWELEAAVKATGEGYISGSDAAAVAERANYEYAKSVGVATGETDALGNAIYRLPDDTEVSVNAQTQRATEDIQRVEDKVNEVDGQEAVVNARVNGLDKVRIDLDALTRPRTMTVTAKLNQAFSANMGWNQ